MAEKVGLKLSIGHMKAGKYVFTHKESTGLNDALNTAKAALNDGNVKQVNISKKVIKEPKAKKETASPVAA